MSITYINSDYLIGFNTSTPFPSLLRTFDCLSDFPFSCFQIYISQGWNLVEYHNLDLLRSRSVIKERQYYVCIHGNLLFNLCGSVTHEKDPRFSFKLRSIYECLTRELDIGVALGVGVVVHPGTCKNKEAGLETIAQTVTKCLTLDTPKGRSLAKDMGITQREFKKRRKIILENASGGGTKLAVTLEEIAAIVKLIPDHLKPQVKVCIDTAHAFGAGLYRWGLRSEVKRFYQDFDRVIGLQYLEVFHLNDSRASEDKRKDAPFGSGKDRHEYLGEGYIFGSVSEESPGKLDLNDTSNLEGLKEFFFQARKRHIPVIGEPPHSDRLGRPALGGIREWFFISDLLSDTDCPLET